MKSAKIFLNSICFIFHFVLLFSVLAAKDVLFPGDELNSLNSNSTLISANGKFTLGFFTIPSTTNFTYLGIWYTDTHQGLKVWVANRDIPMIGHGVLNLDDSGNLKIFTGGGFFFNVSDQVGSGNKTRAVLEDSGNFLVYDDTTHENNRILWQSFDHPTDMLLPGMKIGYNLTTKQNWTLTSWLSDQFPAAGAFTWSLEQYQNSIHSIIYRRGEIYWISGAWDKNKRVFQNQISSVNSPISFQHNLSVISDASGIYFTFQTIVTASTMVQLSPNGQLLEFIDGINHFSLTPEFCYGYQNDNGCVVSALPNCRVESDIFQLKSGDWIGGLSNYDNNSSISHIDCMERCWKDCNCSGFMTNSNGTGCRTWGKDQPFRVDETFQTTQKYVLVSQNSSKKKTWIWILVSLASVLTSVLVAYLFYVMIRRRKVKEQEQQKRNEFIHQWMGSKSFNNDDALEGNIFSFNAILAATDNFSNNNKLGKGGYGQVYKGKLSDGREIAVKRLSKTSDQGTKEFNSELILISKLQHTNLVRLYGCCIHEEEKMLVYEFMPNKSLDFFLFAEDRKEKLNWQVRFNIIEGVAQGLLYLHKYSRLRVIHRDLKVSNVLLDDNMNPKIADFGMARIFQQNVTKAMTKTVVGTFGYIAPEYAVRGTFSIKSDVYSFGVLMLEIVSGKRNSSFNNYDKILNLMGHAWDLWKRKALLELKDETLGQSYDVKQLLRSIQIGLLCVQENADDRPTMSEVISMLNNEIADLPNPKQPAFFINTKPVENYLAEKNNPISVNGLTHTQMEPR